MSVDVFKPGTIAYYERLIEEEQVYSQGRVDQWNKAIDSLRQLARDDELQRLESKLSLAIETLEAIDNCVVDRMLAQAALDAIKAVGS